MKKREIIGVLLIIGPLILLMIVLAAYAMISFILSQLIMVSSDPGNMSSMASAITIVLQVLGILSILGVLFGIPTGIYLLVKDKEEKKTAEVQK